MYDEIILICVCPAVKNVEVNLTNNVKEKHGSDFTLCALLHVNLSFLSVKTKAS